MVKLSKKDLAHLKKISDASREVLELLEEYRRLDPVEYLELVSNMPGGPEGIAEFLAILKIYRDKLVPEAVQHIAHQSLD